MATVDPRTRKIRQERRLLQNEPIEGVLINWPSGSDNELVAEITAPEDSLYAGDIFTVTITLGDKYPRVPPRAVMNTPIFHPNICSNGAICVACLRRSWNQTVTIHQLLEEIVHALRHPNPDDELSLEAANMMKSDPKKFELVVREQVAKNRAQRGV